MRRSNKIESPSLWWADIKGYEGLYEVSIEGEVRSLGRIDSNGHPVKKRILKPGKTSSGYLSVVLCKNGKVKTHLVHRLVAEAWLPNAENLPCVNHKDEDKTNNHVNNLEWCSYRYNLNYGTRNERTSKPVVALDKQGRIIHVFPSAREAGRNGFHSSSISDCCNGKLKTHRKLVWLYKEDFLKKIS